MWTLNRCENFNYRRTIGFWWINSRNKVRYKTTNKIIHFWSLNEFDFSYFYFYFYFLLFLTVDNESSLHHEEDPRYRGGAIPSRAFRFLQTMTESGDAPVVNTSKFYEERCSREKYYIRERYEEWNETFYYSATTTVRY